MKTYIWWLNPHGVETCMSHLSQAAVCPPSPRGGCSQLVSRCNSWLGCWCWRTAAWQRCSHCAALASGSHPCRSSAWSPAAPRNEKNNTEIEILHNSCMEIFCLQGYHPFKSCENQHYKQYLHLNDHLNPKTPLGKGALFFMMQIQEHFWKQTNSNLFCTVRQLICLCLQPLQCQYPAAPSRKVFLIRVCSHP